MRILLDTNVFISALFWRGPSHQIWTAVRMGAVDCLTSDVLLAELREVLTRTHGSFRLTDAEYHKINRKVRKHCQVIRPKLHLRVVEDDADNRVLECAVAGRVNLIVTGDQELLRIRDCQGIRIVPPARGWDIIAGEPQPFRRRRKK